MPEVLVPEFPHNQLSWTYAQSARSHGVVAAQGAIFARIMDIFLMNLPMRVAFP